MGVSQKWICLGVKNKRTKEKKMLASMIARASTSRARVVSSSSSASSSFEFSASFARAAQKHQLHPPRVRISPRRTHLNGIHEQQDRSNNGEEAHDNDGKDHPSNPRSSVNTLNTLLRESRRKSKPNMSDEDREEALEQMQTIGGPVEYVVDTQLKHGKLLAVGSAQTEERYWVGADSAAKSAPTALEPVSIEHPRARARLSRSN